MQKIDSAQDLDGVLIDRKNSSTFLNARHTFSDASQPTPSFWLSQIFWSSITTTTHVNGSGAGQEVLT